MPNAEQVTEPLAVHGEGPVWDDGLLRWVDMLRGDLLTMDVASQAVQRLHLGDVVAAVRPRRRGGLVLALEREFAVLDPGDVRPRPLVEVWSDPGVRMNEGGCDPQGRFYAGSMGYDPAPGRGALYRIDPDGSVATVLCEVTISNGIAWSPDGSTTYYIDTPTQRVDAFDFDADRGELTGRRTVTHIDDAQGSPDGMTVDADGGLWVALWGGSAVHRYTPDGKLDEVVELPVPQVSACTFGGDDLAELYITTSRHGVPDGQQPLAGATFRYRPGVRGLPVLPFAG